MKEYCGDLGARDMERRDIKEWERPRTATAGVRALFDNCTARVVWSRFGQQGEKKRREKKGKRKKIDTLRAL